MIALMAIMILCSADTCTISSDDNETFYDGNSDMQLRGTAWKAYSFNDNSDWYTPDIYGCDFSIHFYEYGYEARFSKQVDEGNVKSRDNLYQGKYAVQGRSISCYDGNEDKESIRIEVVRTNNGQMTATIFPQIFCFSFISFLFLFSEDVTNHR